jgi:hypothetical protein
MELYTPEESPDPGETHPISPPYEGGARGLFASLYSLYATQASGTGDCPPYCQRGPS